MLTYHSTLAFAIGLVFVKMLRQIIKVTLPGNGLSGLQLPDSGKGNGSGRN